MRDTNFRVEELPWIGYRFYCGSPRCRGHEAMVIDWEAQELFRRYRMSEGPVKEKLFKEMLSKKDLYFIVGNTWRYHRSFMIVGLFYPPKGTAPIDTLTPVFKEPGRQRSLLDFSREG